jgi:hypothetical protein
MVTDIERFGSACDAIYESRAESAKLDPLEPGLRVWLEVVDKLGHLRSRVEITADHLNQAHRFDFEIDQSYLPEIVRQCSAIVQLYRIRGRP